MPHGCFSAPETGVSGPSLRGAAFGVARERGRGARAPGCGGRRRFAPAARFVLAGPRPPSRGSSAGPKVSPGAGFRARRAPAPGVRAFGDPLSRRPGERPPAARRRAGSVRAGGVRAAAGRGRCYSNARANGPPGLQLRGPPAAPAAEGGGLGARCPPRVRWGRAVGTPLPRTPCLGWSLPPWFISTAHRHPIFRPEPF